MARPFQTMPVPKFALPNNACPVILSEALEVASIEIVDLYHPDMPASPHPNGAASLIAGMYQELQRICRLLQMDRHPTERPRFARRRWDAEGVNIVSLRLSASARDAFLDWSFWFPWKLFLPPVHWLTFQTSNQPLSGASNWGVPLNSPRLP